MDGGRFQSGLSEGVQTTGHETAAVLTDDLKSHLFLRQGDDDAFLFGD